MIEIINGVEVECSVEREAEIVADWASMALSSEQIAINAIASSLEKAVAFGNKTVSEFTIGNILLGINLAQAESVLVKMQSVLVALQSGSLYVAIARAKAIDPSEYDATFVTAIRLLEYVNKIETYLNITLSETL